MHRAMSHMGDGGRIIEHAGSGREITLGDQELRERCRNAPLFIRRHIDARREARGLPPLWGSRRAGKQGAGGAALVARMKSFLALARARRAGESQR